MMPAKSSIERDSRWIADWLPHAREAARALEPIAEQLPGGILFEESIHRVGRDSLALFSEAGVAELAEVVL